MKTKPMTASCEYDFTLALTGIAELTQQAEDALFEAGCDDATLTTRSSRIYATFSRRAGSLKEAIVSAIRDVRNANIGADVLRIEECHFVTQSEIARKLGRTRQLVSQYAAGTRGPRDFPPPAFYMADNAPLYNWCEVANWLWQNDFLKEEVYREAEELAVINSVLELAHNRRSNRALTEEVLQAVGDPA